MKQALNKTHTDIPNMNILIVKLSAIGDVIHTLPAVNAIRRRFPDAVITWLIEETAYPLIEGHPSIDRILISKRKRWLHHIMNRKLSTAERKAVLKEIRQFLCDLRDTRYDIVLDFQALLKSAVLISLVRGRRKIGFDKGMAHDEHSYLFLNERIPPVSMDHHAIIRNLMMLERAGIYSREIDYRLPIQVVDKKKANDILVQQGVNPHASLIAINPIAKWDTKLWSPLKFAELGDRIIDECHKTVIWTGGFDDVNAIQKIQSNMRLKSYNLSGKTSLKTLAAIYQRSELLVTTDTGPMHLAAAVGTPTAAIFGPTAPWRTGPFGLGHRVIRAGIKCSPCFKRTCQTVDCMNQITVDSVMKEVKAML